MDITAIPPKPGEPRYQIELSHDEAVALKGFLYYIEAGTHALDVCGAEGIIGEMMDRLPGTRDSIIRAMGGTVRERQWKAEAEKAGVKIDFR